MGAKAKGSAQGQYLGYGLQSVRLFYHLLTCGPEAYVGTEHEDDVSVHDGSITQLVEQCKSATSTNPLGDWSIGLWKTFATWVENAKNSVFEPETTAFRLYVTPPKTGKLVKLLSDAVSDDEILKILESIQSKLTKRKTKPASNSHIQSVFAADKKLLVPIIRNFRVLSEDIDPLVPIYDFLDATVSKHILEAACRYGIGHAKELVERQMRQGEDPLIHAAAFRQSFKAFIAKHDSARVLHSISEAPSAEVVENILSSAPTFIAQLDLVKANTEIKTRAASDYLRSSADRTDWAAQGHIFENSIAEYEDSLSLRHQNINGELEISSSHLPNEKRGLLLYHRCCASVPLPLEGRVVPEHFLPGTLNAMADRLKIGWHPNFSNLLKAEELEEV